MVNILNLPRVLIMFTLEESALLSRMLRFVGWALVTIAVVTVAYFLFR